MARISARTATWAKWAVVPAALLVSGVAVSQASYSAFSATTQSEANNWKAGTVKLDSGANKAVNGASAGTAMFTAANLKPGSTGAKCITVTSSGSLASTVKLYATNAKTTNKLSSSIDLVITEGTGGDSTCAGFTPAAEIFNDTLAVLGSKKSFAAGVGSWTPSGTAPETRTYKIVYTLNAAAPNSTQDGTASMGFTWEAQNS
jgi:hypothetical protein